MSGRDAFRDDGRLGVPSDVNHLGTRVGLLVVVGDGHGIELCHAVVATQDARRVFPRDSRTRLHLRPRQFRTLSAQVATLRDEVEHATLTLGVARIPVLYRRVFYFCSVHDDNLDDGSVQLVLVAHRCRAAFEIADVAVVVGNDQRTLELSGIAGIDAEVAAQLHRTAHTLWNIDKGTVAEDGAVEGGIEIVAVGHHRA